MTLVSWSARFLSKAERNSMELWRGDYDKTAVEKLGSTWFLCMYSTYDHWARQTRNTTLDQVETGRQEWRQLGCSFDLYLLVLVSTYRRSINSITGWNDDPRGEFHQIAHVLDMALAQSYRRTKMAKVQPSLALENAREKSSGRIRTPIRFSRTAGLSGCQRKLFFLTFSIRI